MAFLKTRSRFTERLRLWQKKSLIHREHFKNLKEKKLLKESVTASMRPQSGVHTDLRSSKCLSDSETLDGVKAVQQLLLKMLL